MSPSSSFNSLASCAAWSCGSIVAGRGARASRRSYSAEQAATAEQPPRPQPKDENADADGTTTDNVTEKASYNHLSERPYLQRLLEQVEEDPLHKIDQAADKKHYPIGLPYTTAYTSDPRRGRDRQEEAPDTGGQVHILGYDPRAYFMAHQLGSYKYLDPVKLLIHKRVVMNSWRHEGEGVTLWKGTERSMLRGRAEAEWIGRGFNQPSNEHIQQLVVTLPCGVTKPALQNILHRIDNRTTICFIQDGLGVIEQLNNTLFVDPTTRPNYILGHSTASLGYNKKQFFSAILKKTGKLYLHSVERGIDLQPMFKMHPSVQNRRTSTQFLRTLVTTPGLNAGGFGLENFLMKKLPAMVFSAIIEPMAIVLDTSYDQVLLNERAILLADELLEELFNVIMSLPELTNSSKVVEHCGMDALRKETLDRLVQKGVSNSLMLTRVRAGQWVDIDYLNGYFVRRGRELGIKTPQNEMVVDVVKARIEKRKKDMKGLIPFDETFDPNQSSF
ncbi:putative 2-dehydropantoate 2-reductase [Cytospora mali]|uniref:2-dehydropantoate 2-reductase n=1 Tax=Cytospora mali TaxID=578113 RepID=A0A194VFR1_CYTMA|nr:putative 2-dehydropantoate 2-reductase [Valsa mali var. pyri (nom. inval.)]